MDQKHVSGAPTKRFFIHTITKDISLQDCIFDLIDNCLDGAAREIGHPQPQLMDGQIYAKFRIRVVLSSEKFQITDNCGGISLNDAVHYAFTFGAVEDDKPDDFSIGLYGIGMKRAVFKMGRDISIVSRFDGRGDEPATCFRVPINVPKWRKRKDWDFDLEESSPLPEPGVELTVEDLHETVAKEFGEDTFVNSLRAAIARDYSQFLARGLVLEVNGKPVRPYDFKFLSSDKIKPFRRAFKLKSVDIEMVAGLAARPADSYDPDEIDATEDRSGWYVICNGRIVLAADKSELTGWGYQSSARWHPQYRGFVGIILFTAKNAADLPLTSTKRSIDFERDIYRLALVRMMEITRSWINYTNQRKSALADATAIERAAEPISLASVPRSPTLVLPTFKAAPASPKLTTIQYPKAQAEINALAVAFGDPRLSAREVGIRSFDFASRELGAGRR
jgi:hypothetical protein